MQGTHLACVLVCLSVSSVTVVWLTLSLRGLTVRVSVCLFSDSGLAHFISLWSQFLTAVFPLVGCNALTDAILRMHESKRYLPFHLRVQSTCAEHTYGLVQDKCAVHVCLCVQEACCCRLVWERRMRFLEKTFQLSVQL